MPQTVKILPDGSAYEIGDTQGVMVPDEMSFCIGLYSGPAISGTTLTKVPIIVSTSSGGEDWFNNANQIVIPETGVYDIEGAITFGNGPVSMREVIIIRNNSGWIANAATASDANGSWGVYSIRTTRKLQAGDVIELYFRDNAETNVINAIAGRLTVLSLQKEVPDFIVNRGHLVSSNISGLGHINQDGTFNINGLQGPFVRSVDGVVADNDSDIPLSLELTSAEYAAYENPVGSGLYPTLAGKTVTLKDVYPESGAVYTVPDYANTEVTNRIPTMTVVNNTTHSGTWTAYKSGFVVVGCYYGLQNVTNGNAYIYINIGGATVLMEGQDTITDARYMYCKRLFPVKQEDVIEIRVRSDNQTIKTASPQCLFIPPKFVYVPNPTIVVEPGGDESTTEHPVLINDNGVIRQKKTDTGDPIWERTFRGTITIAANTQSIINLDTTTIIKEYVDASGFVDRGNVPSGTYTKQIPIQMCYSQSSTLFFAYAVTGYDNKLALVSQTEYARSNAPYKVTMQYTKA
jgi:hypothetical protein